MDNLVSGAQKSLSSLKSIFTSKQEHKGHKKEHNKQRDDVNNKMTIKDSSGGEDFDFDFNDDDEDEGGENINENIQNDEGVVVSTTTNTDNTTTTNTDNVINENNIQTKDKDDNTTNTTTSQQSDNNVIDNNNNKNEDTIIPNNEQTNVPPLQTNNNPPISNDNKSLSSSSTTSSGSPHTNTNNTSTTYTFTFNEPEEHPWLIAHRIFPKKSIVDIENMPYVPFIKIKKKENVLSFIGFGSSQPKYKEINYLALFDERFIYMINMSHKENTKSSTLKRIGRHYDMKLITNIDIKNSNDKGKKIISLLFILDNDVDSFKSIVKEFHFEYLNAVKFFQILKFYLEKLNIPLNYKDDEFSKVNHNQHQQRNNK